MLDKVLFQATGESLPVLSIESGGCGKPLGPIVPKREVVIKRKANPEIMKRITNFVLEIFIGELHDIQQRSAKVSYKRNTHLY